MNSEKAARELLEHDGIFAVAISPSSEQTFAIADEKSVNDKLMSLGSAMIALHRRNDLQGPSRMMISEEPFGSVSVVTNTVEDVLVSVVVHSGHSVCKSLQRMIKRAVVKAKKVGNPRASAIVSVPEAVA